LRASLACREPAGELQPLRLSPESVGAGCESDRYPADVQQRPQRPEHARVVREDPRHLLRGQVEQPGDVEAAAAHLQHSGRKRRPSQPGQRM